MLNAPVPGLVPAPAPAEASLHPLAVQVQANQPVNPRTLLGAFGQIFEDAGSPHTAERETLALVVGTSGSTGTPKRTALTARALAASAEATEAFFRVEESPVTTSQWLLALPAHYVAGAQVLARSVLTGTSPVIARSVTEPIPFSPDVFLHAAEAMSSPRRFVSLVPTQLHKLFEAAQVEPTKATEIYGALRSFTGILLGGAPASTDLLTAARELGLNVVTTYGSAETAGGCVYSGRALPGVRVELVPEEGMPEISQTEESCSAGRIWISGPHLAEGYLGNPGRTAEHFFTAPDGSRWYRTDDYGLMGTLNSAGRPAQLRVLGRSDDVIISGGVKISARAVAEVLEAHPAVREAYVCGLPDARWGNAIAAAVTLVPAAADRAGTRGEICSALRSLCSERLGVAAAPKQLSILPDFPVASTGKPDRRKIYSILDRDYRGSSAAPTGCGAG